MNPDLLEQLRRSLSASADATRTPATRRAPRRTALNPLQERAFGEWYAEQAQRAGLDPNPDSPLQKYDYRGAFLAGESPVIDPTDGLPHWPSRYKDDDHPNRFVAGVGDSKALDSAEPAALQHPILDQLRAALGPSRTASTPLPPVMVTAPARQPTMGPRGTEPSYAPPSDRERMVGAARDVASFVPLVGEAQDVAASVREAVQGNMGGAAQNLLMAGMGAVPLGDVARLAKRVPAAARDAMVMENPRFRRWFGSSTATDPATGLPLTVMHATDAMKVVRGAGTGPMYNVRPDNFDTFRMPREGTRQLGIHVGVDPRQGDRFASYSTSPEETTKMMQAVDFADNMAQSMPDADRGSLYQSVNKFIDSMMKQGGRTMPLYVRAENPLRLADRGSWSGTSMEESMREMAPDLLRRFESDWGPVSEASESELRKFLSGEGYDSIVYRNRYEGVPLQVERDLMDMAQEAAYAGLPVYAPNARGLPEAMWEQMPVADSYILFDPRQIKSAIGNDGGFRRNTANINRGLLMGLLGGGAAGGLGAYVANQPAVPDA